MCLLLTAGQSRQTYLTVFLHNTKGKSIHSLARSFLHQSCNSILGHTGASSLGLHCNGFSNFNQSIETFGVFPEQYWMSTGCESLSKVGCASKTISQRDQGKGIYCSDRPSQAASLCYPRTRRWWPEAVLNTHFCDHRGRSRSFMLTNHRILHATFPGYFYGVTLCLSGFGRSSGTVHCFPLCLPLLSPLLA